MVMEATKDIQLRSQTIIFAPYTKEQMIAILTEKMMGLADTRGLTYIAGLAKNGKNFVSK